MQKKRGKLIIGNIAFSEIFLLIFAVVAFAFIVGEAGRVSADIITTLPSPTRPGYDFFSENQFGVNKFTDTPVPTGSGGGADKIHKLIQDSLNKGPAPMPVSQYHIFTKGAGSYKPFDLVDLPEFLGTGPTAHLVQGVVWAAVAYFAIGMLGDALGLEEGQTQALQYGAVAGIMAGKFVIFAEQSGFASSIFGEGALLGNAGFVGLGVGIAVFILTYKDTDTQKINFECLPWEAPLGGQKCELCNEDELRPCSEYRCKALGQACDIVNKGTIEEQCVWVSPNDVTAPTITPWEDVLTENHRYTNHDILPPSLGAKVVRNPDNCIQAFTPLEFGIQTNEPAQCKIDIYHSNGTGQEVFDNMNYYFGDNFYRYNHTEQLSLPGPGSLNKTTGFDSPEIPVDGIYNFYTRCRDANGNFNVQEFVFQICVDPSPDTTAPVIVDTSIKSGSYVAFGSDSVNVEFYINEPAQCKWDAESKSYADMSNSMECSQEVREINAQQTYVCSTNLTGITDRADNKFYVRCEDQPDKAENERNTNTQSYEYILKGSQPLNIISSGPNETIFGSTSTVDVNLTIETSNGAEEGKAICYFSSTGNEGSYITMFDTGGYEHSQLLQLTEDDYNYRFRCVDAGGNSDEGNTEFSVEVDSEAPMITRAYRADGLKIVTDEDAECSYSLNSCNYAFDEGLRMIYSNQNIKNVHFAEWQSNLVYYIKCRDFYGNQPSPDQCSMIASASNVN